MMLLAALLFMANPTEREIMAGDDEAATAYEVHLLCLATASVQRTEDQRDAKLVAAEIIATCRPEGEALRAALIKAFTKNQHLLAAKRSPQDAADADLAEVPGMVERMIIDQRIKK
jgi:hypothetical protein